MAVEQRGSAIGEKIVEVVQNRLHKIEPDARDDEFAPEAEYIGNS